MKQDLSAGHSLSGKFKAQRSDSYISQVQERFEDDLRTLPVKLSPDKKLISCLTFDTKVTPTTHKVLIQQRVERVQSFFLVPTRILIVDDMAYNIYSM